MARADGCGAAGDAVVWSVVLALALAVAGLAARMLARATSGRTRASAWTAPRSASPVRAMDVAPVGACDVVRAPAASCSAGDPALALLAWLAALGWVMFDGAPLAPAPVRRAPGPRMMGGRFD